LIALREGLNDVVKMLAKVRVYVGKGLEFRGSINGRDSSQQTQFKSNGSSKFFDMDRNQRSRHVLGEICVK
jgi:hypothetical protein